MAEIPEGNYALFVENDDNTTTVTMKLDDFCSSMVVAGDFKELIMGFNPTSEQLEDMQKRSTLIPNEVLE